MIELSKYLIVSLGPNCYPRGMIKKVIKNNPNDPWVWNHFFDASSLKIFLTDKGIKTVAEHYEIIDNSNSENPVFWNEEYKIWCPHINQKEKFISLKTSRELFLSTTSRRLHRLKSICQDKKIIFVTSANRPKNITKTLQNQTCTYHYTGYDYTTYERDMTEFLEEASFHLNVKQSDFFLWKVDVLPNLNNFLQNVKTDEISSDLKIKKCNNIQNGFVFVSEFTPESFSFETGEGTEKSKIFWYNWFEIALNTFDSVIGS